MIAEYTHTVDNQPCVIRVVTTPSDMAAFSTWLAEQSGIIACDTETTGLAIWEPGYAVRCVQFGTATHAWVIVVDDPTVHAMLTGVLQVHLEQHSWVFHNAKFDILSMLRCGLIAYDQIKTWMSRAMDTQILAHHLDPRPKGEERAIGHSLKELCAKFVDKHSPDTQKDLHAAFKRDLGCKRQDEGWAHPDATKLDIYLRYAGLDVLLTSRLLPQLMNLLTAAKRNMNLAMMDHEVNRILTEMSARGVKCDVEYTKGLVKHYRAVERDQNKIAKAWGVASVNSSKQVADALAADGVELEKVTATGAKSVDSSVLLPLAGLNPFHEPLAHLDEEPHPLAQAVVASKRARKWRTSYLEAFLAQAANDGRIHTGINVLGARTGRMSIFSPPLQQLPSKGWQIRRCLVADEGMSMIASDYKQVELRVLAALGGVTAMQQAVKDGVDLHDRTADLVFGPGNWGARERGVCKAVNFLQVYGGGPGKLAENTGLTLERAREVYENYAQSYPEVKRYGARLTQMARENGWAISNVYGRWLPGSEDFSYAFINYAVQSSARELLASALVSIDRAGLGGFLLLPVHDEVIAQAPAEMAEDVAQVLGSLMEQPDFFGTHIASDPKVLGESWGHGYGAPDSLSACLEALNPKDTTTPAGSETVEDS